MQVNLIGLGGGAEENLTAEARRALDRAHLVLGAHRLLKSLPAGDKQTLIAATRSLL